MFSIMLRLKSVVIRFYFDCYYIIFLKALGSVRPQTNTRISAPFYLQAIPSYLQVSAVHFTSQHLTLPLFSYVFFLSKLPHFAIRQRSGHASSNSNQFQLTGCVLQVKGPDRLQGDDGEQGGRGRAQGSESSLQRSVCP